MANHTPVILTLDTFGQSQSFLHVPADCIQAVLKLPITVTFLTPAGVVTTVMMVTTFGHGWDSYVKLQTDIFIIYHLCVLLTG